MRTDTLTALLLDPFLTFTEAEKEYGATPAAPRLAPQAGSSVLTGSVTGTAPRSPRSPARAGDRGVRPVHPRPATAG
jgi:hypothetical protein